MRKISGTKAQKAQKHFYYCAEYSTFRHKKHICLGACAFCAGVRVFRARSVNNRQEEKMSWTTEPLSALASRTTNGHALAALRAPIASAYSYRPQRVGATGNVRGATANLKLTFRLDRSGGSAAATTSASVRRSMSCIHEQPTEGVRPTARENGQIRPSTRRSGYPRCW